MRIGLREAALIFLLLATAAIYFVHVPDHPPGFSIDESSICYNAYTISQTGRDEYGVSSPLFFRAFGEYKNPTLIYILAGLFRATGPSIAVARSLAAGLGVLSGLLFGWLAWKMTRDWLTATTVSIGALLTPWLFESSRLVFEVAIYPALVVLFLLATWDASLRPKWSWRNVVALVVTLGLLTYSYSIGRLLAPLLALGLGLFINRIRWAGVVGTWLLYGVSLVPLIVFHNQHPDALTGRFKALTYLRAEVSLPDKVKEFALHYLANVNPWRWLVTGEGDIRDHVQGTGSLLVAAVLLSLIGLAIVLGRRRHDTWWRFLVYALMISPIPASLTSNPFPQLRLIAFPVVFLVFMVPAVQWLVSKTKWIPVTLVLPLILAQGFFFQWRYHKGAPSLWYVFDARFPRKVLSPALATGRPIVLMDEPGKSGYIDALWYGVLAGVNPGRFVRLAWGDSPISGSAVISTAEDCQDCRLLARALNYIVYSVPPYPDPTVTLPKVLTDCRASIICENAPATLIAGQTVSLRFLIRNTSSVEWPSVGNIDGMDAVVLQNRWRNREDAIAVDRDAEQRIPYDIEPKDTVGLGLQVTAPDYPGDYWLEVDLVQQPATWFGEQGSIPWKCKVSVTAKK
jgi:4-amino-4-deoxy-L-arabinose transferase-like glycosyltransferase